MTELLSEPRCRSAEDLLIVGTNTSAGKNFLACGLLRAAKNQGLRIKPFKPIEVDNFAPVQTALQPGIYLQACAAGVEVENQMNPIRVVYSWKWGEAFGPPNLYLSGEDKGEMSTKSLTESAAKLATINAMTSLKRDGSRLLIEAPGSFCESISSPAIKALLEEARPDLIVIADFSRGGGLASIVGTLALMPEHIRDRVIGVVTNHLDPAQGIELPQRCSHELRTRFGVGVVGMLPTWTEGFDAISENEQNPDYAVFESQVDRLSHEFTTRFHPKFMAAL